MQLKDKKFLPFRLGDKIWETYINHFNDSDINKESIEHSQFIKSIRNEISGFMAKGEGNSNLLLTQTAQEIIRNIKIDKLDYRLLNNVDRTMGTLLMNENEFYRYYSKEGNIYVLYMKSSMTKEGEYLDFHHFRIDTINSLLGTDGKYREEENLFIQSMIFIELSDKETIFLKPNQKVGTKNTGRYKNDSSHNITIVNSKWNKEIIRTEGFEVRGHFRLQPYGNKDNPSVKLIYIDQFRKDGYKRTYNAKTKKENEI